MNKKLIKIKTLVIAFLLSLAFTSSAYANSNSIKLMFTGDLMCTPGIQEAAFTGSDYDFDYVFQYIKKVFGQADYVVGNLETNISEQFPFSKDLYRVMFKPSLNSPNEYLDALKKAGYDGLVMANNHNCDYGLDGIKDTIKAVEDAGFDHTGLYDSKNDDHYFIIEKNGFKIGVLAYATYFNKKENLLTDSEQDYVLSRLTKERIEKDVKAAKSAGAEYIVAYNHCGDEYSQKIASRQTRYFKMMAEAGVDYLIGSHPHVLQQADIINVNGKNYPAIYSMGNFISSLSKKHVNETIVLQMELTRDWNGRVVLKDHAYLPCYMADVWNEQQYVLIPEGFEDTSSEEKKVEAEKAYKNVRAIIEKKIKWR